MIKEITRNAKTFTKPVCYLFSYFVSLTSSRTKIIFKIRSGQNVSYDRNFLTAIVGNKRHRETLSRWVLLTWMSSPDFTYLLSQNRNKCFSFQKTMFSEKTVSKDEKDWHLDLSFNFVQK